MDGGSSRFDGSLLPSAFRPMRALHGGQDFPHMAVGADERGQPTRSSAFDAFPSLHFHLPGRDACQRPVPP
eukprot:13381368-Heterocapsa_arctica.AAC.1